MPCACAVTPKNSRLVQRDPVTGRVVRPARHRLLGGHANKELEYVLRHRKR